MRALLAASRMPCTKSLASLDRVRAATLAAGAIKSVASGKKMALAPAEEARRISEMHVDRFSAMTPLEVSCATAASVMVVYVWSMIIGFFRAGSLLIDNLREAVEADCILYSTNYI